MKEFFRAMGGDVWKNMSFGDIMRLAYFSLSVILFALAAVSNSPAFALLSLMNLMCSVRVVKKVDIKE